MNGGDHFKIVYEAMNTAGRDIQNTAAQIGQAAEDQVARMRNTIGAGWGGNNAEEMGQQFALMQKRTGYHVDGMNQSGRDYDSVSHIGQTCEGRVSNIINS
ncbi:hypothetical protein LCL61_33420 [Amycolatopsis coloradensis]|uniref:Uncharacterized protein n=1 Tax=Amycolatopsis coloradensis TaxID=76021 RepID=A0ACD5BMI7_9PSEU